MSRYRTTRAASSKPATWSFVVKYVQGIRLNLANASCIRGVAKLCRIRAAADPIIERLVCFDLESSA